MDVDSFIRQYEAEWRGLEAQVSTPRPATGADADALLVRYLRVSGHLAEVRTRYRDADLERYLNDLVTRARGVVYGARGEDRERVRTLAIDRYREEIRTTRPFIAVAAAILIVVTMATWWWVANSPETREGIFTPGVQGAIERAGGGRDPAAGPPPGITTVIMLNNIQVAFLAFGLGISFGVGTVWILVQNAVLLGSLAGAFQAADKAGPFWALILPHGLLELFAICISAGAGLRIGWAMIRPGELQRGPALREAASGAVVVVLGVIPAFVVAAAIEGFTTGTSVPDSVEIGLGIVAFVAYAIFVFKPARRKVVATPEPIAAPDRLGEPERVTAGPLP